MAEPGSVAIEVVVDAAPVRRHLVALLRLCDEVGAALETAIDALDEPADPVEAPDG